jgi:serine/threonine-protein kinase HipA
VSEKRLVVSLPGRVVGELAQERSGLVRWIPEPEWDRDQEPRLGLDFLRTRGQRTHASELPAWFENLLPERGSELRSRLCAAHGLRDGQSFALMRALGGDLIGAVELRDERTASHALEDAIDDADDSDKDGPHRSTADRLSALTGMQLKFSMSMINERLSLPARSGRTQWIVKIASHDHDELAEVPRHFPVQVSDLDGLPEGWVDSRARAFAVQRFDRREDGSRVHQEDLCQALALRPRDKYGDGQERVAFEGVVRLVTDVCGEKEGRELARRMGFVIASGNTDAHLKNWSLLWGERTQPILTPCYDLVTTITWATTLGWRRKDGPTLALPLGGEHLFRRLGAHALDACASRSSHWVTEEIRAGIERARSAWPEAQMLAPKQMRTALEEHWREVPLLAQLGPLG